MPDHALAGNTDSGANRAMITGTQIRGARALLGWSAQDLADRAGVSHPTIQRAESHEGVPNTTAPRLFAIQNALQQAGVVFIGAGEPSANGGPGVRLRR